jgi:hypothetical protein
MAGALTISTLNNDTGVLATQNGMTGIAKAWVNFDGTGTVAIRDSFNVSSITDNGTGDYTINFTTAMPNANYCISGSNSVSGNGSVIFNGLRDNNQTITTTACRIGNTQAGVGLVDPNFVFVAIFSS